MSTDPNEPLANLVEATRRFRLAAADFQEVNQRVAVTFGRLRRRMLRSAYRSGLLAWPAPCSRVRYPHRHRWHGRRPRR